MVHLTSDLIFLKKLYHATFYFILAIFIIGSVPCAKN